MPTFTCKKIGKYPEELLTSGGFSQLFCDDIELCCLQEWAFRCCGISILCNFKAGLYQHANKWWQVKENVDSFVEWVVGQSKASHSYYLADIMFALTDPQVEKYLTHLATHPWVKKLDQWPNKAHGPSDLHLYRLSPGGFK